ncbi:MAG: hypothetical protein WBE26_10570 [Phycisphaerae bacterium]
MRYAFVRTYKQVLDMTEIERGILGRQCLDRCIDNARIKRRKLYPVIEQ